jgi:hypothetical protein
MTFDTSLRPVSPLRARMIEDMTVRGFNEHTRRDSEAFGRRPHQRLRCCEHLLRKANAT